MTGARVRGIAGLGAIALAMTLLAACSGDDDDVDATRSASATYVALGDSISAGGGAGPYEAHSGACLRSRRAWPRLLDVEVPGVELSDLRACGGATVDQLIGATAALGLDSQIPDTPDPEVDLVTLTIGANDLRYLALVFVCAADCGQSTPDAEATYQATLAALSLSLARDVYPALRAAYPEARIIHVGYPRLVTGGDPVDCPWLASDEQVTLDRVLGEMNGAIQASVEQAGSTTVEYLDITEALAGHELCSSDPWVQPLDAGSDGVHPTADGYRAIADAVRSAVGDR